MLDGFKNKFSKLKKSDSIVHKLDKIKNTDQHPDSSQYGPDGQPHPAEFFDTSILEQKHEETVKRIDELLNSKAETINANAESIKTIENRLSKMDISISTVKRNIEEYNERFSKMEENILELLSLYEVVSNTVNPFVGDNENKPKHLERFDTIENRLKNLEGNLQYLESINQQDAVVSEEVLQQVRKEIDEKLEDFNEKLESMIQSVPDTRKEQHIIDEPDYEPPESRADEIPILARSDNSPLLVSINNNSETSIVLLSWVEFLMEKVGRNNLMDVLDYYTEIGWIAEEVSNKILAYASGLDYYDEKPTWKLLPQDHTKSLMFIERLLGKKIDMGTFNKIERDVDKVKHHSEPYFKL